MRKNRKLQENAEYHVTARANRGEMIFNPITDRDLLLEVVRNAKKKYDFEIKNFCIMGNHLHLIIKPGKGMCLSRIMQWILSVFAMRWNRKHNKTGHLWGERFFSRIIAGIVDFIRIFMYIDDNPIHAYLVKKAWEWEYGGLWHHRKGIRGIVEDPEPIILCFFPEHMLQIS